MKYTIEAACLSNRGKVRGNNEDNFYFNGNYLSEINNGTEETLHYSGRLDDELFLSVFDGMGGELYGEAASFAAAHTLHSICEAGLPRSTTQESFLNELSDQLNAAVVEKAREHLTKRMGSTMVLLDFTPSCVYQCNLGDSRAYLLRNGELSMLSCDHVLFGFPNAKGKAPLTRHLGIDPEDLSIEPYISKTELSDGDKYLICSDGVTDMLSEEEIRAILSENDESGQCVEKLFASAMERGGIDNITAIVCVIKADAASGNIEYDAVVEPLSEVITLQLGEGFPTLENYEAAENELKEKDLEELQRTEQEKRDQDAEIEKLKEIEKKEKERADRVRRAAERREQEAGKIERIPEKPPQASKKKKTKKLIFPIIAALLLLAAAALKIYYSKQKPEPQTESEISEPRTAPDPVPAPTMTTEPTASSEPAPIPTPEPETDAPYSEVIQRKLQIND